MEGTTTDTERDETMTDTDRDLGPHSPDCGDDECRECYGPNNTPADPPEVPTTPPVNATTGVEYTGHNVDRLFAAYVTEGYTQNVWATYRQWAENGRQVQKGQHGTRLQRVVTVTDSKTGKTQRALKGFTVFNVAQTAPAEEKAA